MNEPELKPAVPEIACTGQAAQCNQSAAQSIVAVDDPGELIAAIPAMIGFTPKRSLVVIILRTVDGVHLADSVMRFDLDPDEGRLRLGAEVVADSIAQVLPRDDPAAVLAVVVDDRLAAPEFSSEDAGAPSHTGRFQVLLADLNRNLAAESTTLASAWAVPSVEPEEPWRALFGPEQAGVLPGSAASVWLDTQHRPAIQRDPRIPNSLTHRSATRRVAALPSIALTSSLVHGRSPSPMSSQRFDPTELIASMPASLGYDPERRIILVLFNARDYDRTANRGGVASLDLNDPIGEAVASACDMARHIGATGTLAIVVDDRLTYSPSPTTLDSELTEFLATLVDGLHRASAPLTHVWLTKAIAAGSVWWSLVDATDRGVLPDPGRTNAAAVRDAEGYPVYSSRQALIDAVSPDPRVAAEVEYWMPAQRRRVQRTRERAGAQDCWNSYYRHGLLHALFCIADIAAGEDLLPKQFAELAVVLSEQMVLDCLHATASSEYQVQAERLWTQMLRALAGPERAAPAALLAYSAYLRGDGVLALVCVHAALEAKPSHFTSRLLLAALDRGIPADKLPKWTRFGVAAAADLGVDLARTDS